jgi:hypothetical protein
MVDARSGGVDGIDHKHVTCCAREPRCVGAGEIVRFSALAAATLTRRRGSGLVAYEPQRTFDATDRLRVSLWDVYASLHQDRSRDGMGAQDSVREDERVRGNLWPSWLDHRLLQRRTASVRL